jgi:hypothetical protein
MSRRPSPVNMDEWEAGIDRAIAKRRFTASFMSDSKWRRLFTILARPDLGIRQALWKFVDLETPLRFGLPDTEDLAGKLSRSGWFFEPGGESPFKRIEWVEITRLDIPYGWEKIPHKHRQQNVDTAVALLEEAGQFELESTELGVRIYGYR